MFGKHSRTAIHAAHKVMGLRMFTRVQMPSPEFLLCLNTSWCVYRTVTEVLLCGWLLRDRVQADRLVK